MRVRERTYRDKAREVAGNNTGECSAREGGEREKATVKEHLRSVR